MACYYHAASRLAPNLAGVVRQKRWLCETNADQNTMQLFRTPLATGGNQLPGGGVCLIRGGGQGPQDPQYIGNWGWEMVPGEDKKTDWLCKLRLCGVFIISIFESACL